MNVPSISSRGLLLPFLISAMSLAVPAGDWPGWRGVARDGHARDPLPASFAGVDRPLWKKAIGHGYSSPVVSGGRLVYIDDAGGRETVHCLESTTGRELWTNAFAELYADEFEPGPRCTPLVADGRVFVQSCYGEFACLGLEDGVRQWGFHFKDFGTAWVKDRSGGPGAASRRGNSGAPWVDGNRVVVQVGSTHGASLVAFDTASGRMLWKSQDDLTCYSSLVGATLGGRRQAVAVTCEGFLAVDIQDGAPLWRLPFRTGANRNVLTPVVDGDTVTFASHTTGLRRLRIEPAGSTNRPVETWFNRDLKINLSSQVLVGGHLYGMGASRDYVCVEASTGKVLWKQPGFDQYASTIASGGRLLVLDDAGEAILLEADPGKYKELGRFQACGKTFSHPAYSGGLLVTRDPRELAVWTLDSSAR